MIIRLLCCLWLSSAPFLLKAEGYFEYNTQCRQIYSLITSLQFPAAYTALAQLKLGSPDNLVAYHLENYIDFFHLYVNGDKATFDRLKPKQSQRIERVAAGDANSPYYLYIQAEIYLQWAMIRLRFGEQLNGFMDLNKANRLLEKNHRRFPDFLPNLKDLGILHAMVGTIPDNYQWGVKLLTSLNGTITQGKQELEQVLAYAKQHDFIFKEEAYAFYAYLLMHLAKDEKKAWQIINQAGLDPLNNPLHCFVMANIAMRSDHNDDAIRLLGAFKPKTNQVPFPYLNYMLGLAKLRRLDTDAVPYFKQYLSENKSPYYVKEAYQKIAWHFLINGREKEYKANMAACIKTGEAIAEGDKNAMKEAEGGHQPPAFLVEARLLFDGAYYQRANKMMLSHSPEFFADTRDRLEYTYRYGRILHGLKKWEAAIEQYQKTIEHGQNESYFFACNAALQIGLIYEKLQDFAKARAYFKQCLSLNPDEYKAGLHQQAKSGLARLKE